MWSYDTDDDTDQNDDNRWQIDDAMKWYCSARRTWKSICSRSIQRILRWNFENCTQTTTITNHYWNHWSFHYNCILGKRCLQQSQLEREKESSVRRGNIRVRGILPRRSNHRFGKRRRERITAGSTFSDCQRWSFRIFSDSTRTKNKKLLVPPKLHSRGSRYQFTVFLSFFVFCILVQSNLASKQHLNEEIYFAGRSWEKKNLKKASTDARWFTNWSKFILFKSSTFLTKLKLKKNKNIICPQACGAVIQEYMKCWISVRWISKTQYV